VPHDRLGLALVDDAAPQKVTIVRGERVNLATVGLEGDRVVLPVFHPVITVEAPLQVGRLLLEQVGQVRIAPHRAGQTRAPTLRVVRVPLEFAGRARKAGQVPVLV
jgi:hypothetical protein